MVSHLATPNAQLLHGMWRPGADASNWREDEQHVILAKAPGGHADSPALLASPARVLAESSPGRASRKTAPDEFRYRVSA